MTNRIEKKEMKVVVFSLDNKEYALDVEHVVSIERMQKFTRVPHVPPYIKGVINLRGVIIPIIDLRIRMGMEEVPYDHHSRIIIVEMDNKEVGLIVDAANDVMNIQVEHIESQPDIIGKNKQDYIMGVLRYNNRLLILLKLEQVLNLQEDREKE